MSHFSDSEPLCATSRIAERPAAPLSEYAVPHTGRVAARGYAEAPSRLGCVFVYHNTVRSKDPARVVRRPATAGAIRGDTTQQYGNLFFVMKEAFIYVDGSM